MSRDFYEVLGVTRNATAEEITKAYRIKAKNYHPDRNPGDDSAVEKFKEAQNAYETLSDPIKKARYDDPGLNMRFRRKPTKNPGAGSPPPGFSYEDVVSDFFGGSRFKGRNITVRLEIDFKEVLTGCKKHIKVKKRKRCTGCAGIGIANFQPCAGCGGSGAAQVPDAPFQFLAMCPICSGSGKAPGSVVKCGDCLGSGYLPGFQENGVEINIPPGIESGMQVRVAGQGEESVQGGTTGDVMVFVIIKEHPLFSREGPNLIVEVPVSYTQLVLGDEIEIPTLAEGHIKVKVPSGSQSHTKFRIRGKGFPNGKGSMGDLIATLKIETPKTLSEEYKKVLDQLAGLEKGSVTPRREQWAKKVSEMGK